MPETTENRNSINFKQSYQGQYIHQQSSFPLKIMNPKAQKKNKIDYKENQCKFFIKKQGTMMQ